MDQSYDSIVSMSDFRPMIVSPHMSPQLNETICGCRCGCGCGCAGHGNSDDSERLSDSETAIDSSNSEDDQGLSSTQHTHDDGLNSHGSSQMNDGILSPHALSPHIIVWLFGRPEDLRLSELLIGREQVSAGPPLYDGHEDISESPFNNALSSEDRSHAVSHRGSVQMMSPGPGIGAWLVPERTWVEDVQRVYIVTPLRLSAEYQHARGKAVEHLLVPDEASVPDLVQV